MPASLISGQTEEQKETEKISAFDNIFLLDPSNPEVTRFSEAPPCMGMDKEQFIETIAQFKIELNNDTHFFETVKILYTLTNNIAKNPEEKKFQKLRLSNDKIKKFIT